MLGRAHAGTRHSILTRMNRIYAACVTILDHICHGAILGWHLGLSKPQLLEPPEPLPNKQRIDARLQMFVAAQQCLLHTVPSESQCLVSIVMHLWKLT